MSQGKFPQAEEALAENLTLRKELHDLDGMGTVLMEMGSIAFNQDKPAEAEAHFIAARECYEKVGNKRFVSQALYIQAMVAFAEGDFSKATQLSEQAVAIGQELGESTIIALGLVRLGRASSSIGNFDLARSQFEEVLKVSRETGIKQLQAVAHDSLGALAYFQAKYSEAYDHLKQSILLWREIGEEAGISFTLLILAMLIHSRRQYETAARLLGAAERMMPSYGLKFLSPVEIQGLENTRLALQSALGKKAYQQAWAAGQAMDLEQVQELALSQKVPDKLSPVDLLPAGVGLASRARTNVRSRVLALIEPLSERELEVLGMLAAGATNQEIAQKLFIDIGTVKSHNTHIFAKLGVKNRTQAVERARKLGLL